MNQSKLRYQWKKLYHIIKSELVLHGEESWIGDKDFWVVDDFSETIQKVVLSNWNLFNRDIAIVLQDILKRFGGHWEIIVQVETSDIPEDEIVGLVIAPNKIEEHFNRKNLPEQLRSITFQD